MKFEKSLKDLSLDSLLQLLSKSTEQLLASKTGNKEPEMTMIYQRTAELIQKAIVEKQAELPS